MSNHNHSSPFPSCFRSATTTFAPNHHSAAATVAPVSSNPNLTTCVYHTNLGLFALTWSRNLLGRSLHLHLLLDRPSSATDDDCLALPSLSTPSFHLHIRPFIFWNKHGSRKLHINNTTKSIQIFWDLSSAKFGSRPEPQSGFYIAVVVDGEMTLLVGDSSDEAYAKTRATKPERTEIMVLRREHVYGNKLYTTKASFGGKTRNISIDCRVGDDPRLYFSVDHKRIQISWDVYNWLFEDDHDQDGYALFMFRFEQLGFEDEDELTHNLNDKNGMVLWSQQSCGFGFEKKKMKKSLLKTARSSSSSSLSSASSSCSSVMEWASMEENELKGPSGFSLLVYAWKG
ncbi:hypothetical protein F0562_007412 [Nyssa sinensis]|uniref:DUF868 domain-containing protein n=1 Tax=Nyssa sinensis TaxID=561372 RepID=A0A5J5A860_9ASTE|nr:hypothetical protein F0562_007412 [Nyssa sinensis]